MKILILNKYQFKVSRGAETYVFELAKRLSKVHEVKILGNIDYLSILREKFDIVIPTNGRLQVFYMRIVAWLKGAKVVVSGQSGPGLDDRLNLYSFPDCFVALTDFQRKWAFKISPFVKIEKIPNGVDLEFFKPSEKAKNNIVLSVGAFTKEKRHHLTIEAVANLHKVKLIIAGSPGEAEEEIRELGEMKLGSRFQIVSVTHDQMPELYKAASVFAFPTVPWESFGISLIEAMAMNVPVVASDDPIRREIVGQAGILVDPTDTDKYSSAIARAISIKWGNVPRKQAENFSWDKIADSYLGLFNKLTKK